MRAGRIESEVYATGLRNPQELAFNDLGDLFTGDNTSDAGDRARIVFVAQDGETGWTMDYQTLEGTNLRGPWEQERIWEVVTEDNEAFRPDWTLPPLARGAGPSGLAYATGLGLPSEYDDHFFMCDFTGSALKSRIWTFQAVPDGRLPHRAAAHLREGLPEHRRRLRLERPDARVGVGCRMGSHEEERSTRSCIRRASTIRGSRRRDGSPGTAAVR